MQKLLEQHGYDDMEVVRFMKEGVPLVGAHDHPPCYPLKLKNVNFGRRAAKGGSALQDGFGKRKAPDGGPWLRWAPRGDRI